MHYVCLPFPLEQEVLQNETKTPFSINAYVTAILYEVRAFTGPQSTLGYLRLHKTFVVSVPTGLLWAKSNKKVTVHRKKASSKSDIYYAILKKKQLRIQSEVDVRFLL